VVTAEPPTALPLTSFRSLTPYLQFTPLLLSTLVGLHWLTSRHLALSDLLNPATLWLAHQFTYYFHSSTVYLLLPQLYSTTAIPHTSYTMAMQYSGPLSSYTQAVTDQSRPWVTVSTLAQALRNLTNASGATQAGRQLIIDTLISLQGGQPYAIKNGQDQTADLRFSTVIAAGVPLTASLYAALFSDGWSEVFTQLNSAADFQDRQGEKLVTQANPQIGSSDFACNPNSMRSQYNDATYSIRKAAQTGQRLLTACTGVYSYHSFEQKYQLTWGLATEGMATRTHPSLTTNFTDPAGNTPVTTCTPSVPLPSNQLLDAVFGVVHNCDDPDTALSILQVNFELAVRLGALQAWTALYQNCVKKQKHGFTVLPPGAHEPVPAKA